MKKKNSKKQVQVYSEVETIFLKNLGYSKFLDLVNSGDIENISKFLNLPKENNEGKKVEEFFFDF